MNQPQQKILYVCGFLFDEEKNHVLLIKKNKPEWQAGKLNGIGGKMESGEAPLESMVREFKEEAGIYIPSILWKNFCVLKGSDYVVHFFTATVPKDVFFSFTQMTEEKVVCISCNFHYNEHKMLPNLAWLLPLALKADTHVLASEVGEL